MDAPKASATREQALKVARMLGSYGAHQTADGEWMPCVSEDALSAVLKKSPEPAKKSAPRTVVEKKSAKAASRSQTVFDTRAEAEAEVKRRGCSGVRTIKLGGITKFAACDTGPVVQPVHLVGSKKPIWDNLLERPISGITTLPAGGLTEATPPGDFGGMKAADIEPMDAKAFVQYVSRSTDPNVYLDADSAREHSRMIGCIGIRSYTARDGKTVYLPCNNVSDYNRALRLTPSGNKKKSDIDELETKSKKHRPLAKTPAPAKDRIFGSNRNTIGSAGSIGSASDISMTEEILQALSAKVRDHNLDMEKNKKPDWSKTSLPTLKAVYRRGAGAFSTSHRPNVTRNQWAMGRVNAFLNLLSSGSAKASYTTDNDLLPKGHPWKEKGLGSKSLIVDETEITVQKLGSFKTLVNEKVREVNRYIVVGEFPLLDITE